jgi:hypothetical protein
VRRNTRGGKLNNLLFILLLRGLGCKTRISSGLIILLGIFDANSEDSVARDGVVQAVKKRLDTLRLASADFCCGQRGFITASCDELADSSAGSASGSWFAVARCVALYFLAM